MTKRALDLTNGKTHILELTFQEEFKIRVGSLQVKCVRSAELEAELPKLSPA